MKWPTGFDPRFLSDDELKSDATLYLLAATVERTAQVHLYQTNRLLARVGDKYSRRHQRHRPAEWQYEDPVFEITLRLPKKQAEQIKAALQTQYYADVLAWDLAEIKAMLAEPDENRRKVTPAYPLDPALEQLTEWALSLQPERTAP